MNYGGGGDVRPYRAKNIWRGCGSKEFDYVPLEIALDTKEVWG